MKKEILSKELYRISDFLYKNKIVFLEVSIDTMKDNYTDIKFGELYINLDKIVSVSNQAGAGKKGMFEIIKFADKYNLPIMLIASSSMGSDLDRLINFYKEFGFNLIEEIDDDYKRMIRPKKQKNIYEMLYIKKFNEDINVPIKVGDTILGGRFKNRKLVVKKIGKNKKGDITINDKPLLKFRLLKESISQEDIDNGLAYLKDDGFQVNKVNISKTNMIQIYKIKNINDNTIVSNMIEVEWMDIEKDLLPFIELNNHLIKEIIITYPIDNEYDRIILTTEEILNSDKDFGKLVRVTIILKD